MLGFLETFFSVDKDEEQNIQSFSETPAKPTKAKDLTETEDEVQQIHEQTKEEDKEYRDEHTPEDDTAGGLDDTLGGDLGDTGEAAATDTSDETIPNEDQMTDGSEIAEESLLKMNEYEIRMTKIIPSKYLEYATSSGPDVVGGCAGCSKGNEDAADAAIIDAEITPVEKTVPNNPDNGSDNSGGSSDFGGGDMEPPSDDSFSFYYKQYTDATRHLAYIVAQEGMFSDAISNILGTTSNLVGTVAKGAGVVTDELVHKILPAAFGVAKKAGAILAGAYTAVRNTISRILVNKSLLLKVWNTKIKLYLKKVSTERLAKIKIQAFSREDLIKIGKITIDIHDTLVKNGDKITDIKLSDKLVSDIIQQLKAIGIVVDVINDKISLAKYYESRKIGSIMDLGYSPEHIEECILWCIDVSKRIRTKDQSPMLAGFVKIQGFFKSRNNAFVKNAANDKLSPEKRKQDIGIYVSSELKVKFGADVSRIVYKIWNELIAQMLDICEKYEKALIPEVIHDNRLNESENHDETYN